MNKFFEMNPNLSPIERRSLENLSMIYAMGSIFSKMYIPEAFEKLDENFVILTSLILRPFREGDIVLREQINKIKTLLKSTLFPTAKHGVVINESKACNGFKRLEKGEVYLYVKKGFIDLHIEKNLSSRVLQELKRLDILVSGKGESTQPILQAGLQKQRYLAMRWDKI